MIKLVRVDHRLLHGQVSFFLDQAGRHQLYHRRR